MRTRSLITTTILEACSEGASLPNVINAANLDHDIAKSYFDSLARSGLIESSDGITYTTTDKGLEVLGQFWVIQDFLTRHG
jgi:predicted transcriptional regulator